MTTTQSMAVTFTPATILRRSLAALAGAVLVALSAQVALPMPGTVVPVTLQVPTVLIVGCVLGPRLGALSMVVYLGLGVAGLPVYAPPGAPGLARLLGPTGGYLLAFPLAASLAGQLAGDGRQWLRVGLGLVAGLVAVHAGGIAQLAVLSGGDLSAAARLGSLPFLLGDAIKLIVALLLVRRFAPVVRARL